MTVKGDLSYTSSIKSAADATEEAQVVLEQFDPELVKKTWRKVDWYIMPIAVWLYLASYIDRANIGNAKVLGLAKSLNLTSGQYNWALSIFFIGYVIFETPSNILLRKLSPRWYIPALTVLWGLICALFATVKTASGLLAIRFFLGLAEAGFLPGIIYWLSCWYPRSVLGRRFGVLYSTVSLTGAFGGLLATAIHALDGTYGIAGWQWIFIVEGSITAGFGLIAAFVMSAYPATAKFLTEEERRIVILTNEADRAQKATEGFNGKQIRSAFTDWRTYLWALVYISIYIPVYSVILSLPSVVTGLGYKGTTATLMACPPYGLGFIIVLLAGWSADKYGRLFYHYIGAVLVTSIALIVLMAVENLVVRYVMFFFVMFMFIPVSICWVWLTANLAGPNKRAAAMGFVFSVGNIGGTVSGQIYRAEWAPRYVQGHAINLGCYVIAIIAGTALWLSYKSDNRKRDLATNEKVTRTKPLDLIGEDLGDLGDRHPHFRYYL
ncbi:MFS general substrate transporter [Trametes cingulata]|nr:MFS general substrate transporter [Trametes cingulata]